jgi:hypothetical protein
VPSGPDLPLILKIFYKNRIKNKFQELNMGKMFDMLKEGLDDIIAHQRGKKKLKTRVINVPEPTINYKAKDIKRIRESLAYSRR